MKIGSAWPQNIFKNAQKGEGFHSKLNPKTENTKKDMPEEIKKEIARIREDIKKKRQGRKRIELMRRFPDFKL